MPDLKFNLEDWDRIEQNAVAWWAGELERPLVFLTTDIIPNVQGMADLPYSYLSNYPLAWSAEEVVEKYVPYLTSATYNADAFPWFFVNFGPGIAAGFAGSNVHSVIEPSETVWFSNKEKLPIDQIHLEYQADNLWWQRVQLVTRALVERFNGLLAVSHTDLGGNLDILATFRGTHDLLFDVLDDPEEVDRLVAEITRLWLRYYAELDAIIRPCCRGTTSWAPIWSPGKTYMLQSDFSYMISPAMFERFVLPDLTAVCDHLDHGFYHLDGKGQIPHLDMLLSIPRLRGIQWIPGDGQPPPHEWISLMKRIRAGGKLCQVFVTPEGARQIVKSLGGKGFLLVIQSTEIFDSNPDRVQAFLDTLRSEDLSLGRGK